MKRKIILLCLICFSALVSQAQIYVPRTNGTFTPVDKHLGATWSLKIPVWSDTAMALTKAGIDSMGLIFKERLTSKVWIRDTVITGGHKWTLVGPGSGGGGGNDSNFVWGYGTGNINNQLDLINILNGKQATIATGTGTQYFKGDFSLATFPTVISTFSNDAGYIDSVLVQGSITGNGLVGNKLQLVNDNPSPGATMVYGTNGGGTKGWYPASTGSGSVTSVATVSPILGGAITTTGTISLDTTIDHSYNFYKTIWVKYSDTAAMLAPYTRGSGTYLRLVDTAAMLFPYLRFVDTSTAHYRIPSGAGDRFLWMPDIQAFRAGYAGTTSWDSANIGIGSVGFGVANKASGTYSTVAGTANNATGTASTVFGNANTGSGNNSFSVGNGNTSSGLNSGTFGTGNTVSGTNSFGLGNVLNISGSSSVGFGNTNTITSDNAQVFGQSNVVSGLGAVAFGSGNSAQGSTSAVFGNANIAKNTGQLVAGRFNDTTSAINVLAIGWGTSNTTRKNIFSVDSLGNGIIFNHFTGITETGTDSSNFLASTAYVKRQIGGGVILTKIFAKAPLSILGTDTVKADTSVASNHLVTIKALNDSLKILDTIHVIAKGASGLSTMWGSVDTIFNKKFIAGSNITLTQNNDSSVTVTSNAGFTNPMTSAGDIPTGGAGGTPQRLGIGSSGQILTVVSGAPAWSNNSASVNAVTNSNGSLVFSPTTGTVIGSINLANPNSWSALQTYATLTTTGTTKFTGTTYSDSSSGTVAIIDTVSNIVHHRSTVSIDTANVKAGFGTFWDAVKKGFKVMSTQQVDTAGAQQGYLPTWDTAGKKFLMRANAGGLGRIGLLDSFPTPSSNGAVSSGQSLYLQSASTTKPGLINTIAQSFAGKKTFTDSLVGSGVVKLTANAYNPATTGISVVSIDSAAGYKLSHVSAQVLDTTGKQDGYVPKWSGAANKWIVGPGAGGVSSFSAGNATPLFTTSVATTTTTPALSFVLSNAGAYQLFGNNTGSSAGPAYFSPTLASALFANQGTISTVLHGNASGNPSFGAVNFATDMTGVIQASNIASGTITNAMLAGGISVGNGGTGLSSLISGYVPFGNGSSALGSNVNFYWDNIGNRLGINTGASPSASLHVVGSLRFDLGSDGNGDLFYRNASGFLTRLGLGSTGQVLNVTSGLPAWHTPSKADIALGNVENTTLSTWGGSGNIAQVGTITSGIWNGTSVDAAHGGTGLSSYSTGDLIYASASTTLSKLNDIATGNVLLSGGVGVAPSYGKVNLSSMVTGNLSVSNMNSGTGASSSTIWYGDGTWKTAPSSTNIYNTDGTLTGNRIAQMANNSLLWNHGSLTFDSVNTLFNGTVPNSATLGSQLNINSSIFDNGYTATGNTRADIASVGMYGPSVRASNTSVTFLDASTLYIDGAPTASTNVTLISPWAMKVNSGNVWIKNDLLADHQRSGDAGSISVTPIGLGSGATSFVLTGGDRGGCIEMISGSSGIISGAGSVAIITFNRAYARAPSSIILTPANASAASLNAGNAALYVDQSATTTTAFTIKTGNSGIPTSTTFLYYYQVIE